MLEVSVQNIDNVYLMIANTNKPEIAAKKMLNVLKSKRGFYKTNVIHILTPNEKKLIKCSFGWHKFLYAVVVHPNDHFEEDPNYFLSHDNTFKIFIRKFIPNKLIASIE